MSAPIAYLKMQMRASGAASVTHSSDDLPFAHRLSRLYIAFIQVGIEGLKTVAVINEDVYAVPILTCPRVDHISGVSGNDGSTDAIADVYAHMPGVEFLGDPAGGGPDKGTGAPASSRRNGATISVYHNGLIGLDSPGDHDFLPWPKLIGRFQAVGLALDDVLHSGLVLLGNALQGVPLLHGVVDAVYGGDDEHLSHVKQVRIVLGLLGSPHDSIGTDAEFLCNAGESITALHGVGDNIPTRTFRDDGMGDGHRDQSLHLRARTAPAGEGIGGADAQAGSRCGRWDLPDRGRER